MIAPLVPFFPNIFNRFFSWNGLCLDKLRRVAIVNMSPGVLGVDFACLEGQGVQITSQALGTKKNHGIKAPASPLPS